MNNLKGHINCEIEVLKSVKIYKSDVKTSYARFLGRENKEVPVYDLYADSYIELVRELQKLMNENKLSKDDANRLTTIIEKYADDIEEHAKYDF
jgi:chemotaxis regulatin CheY-phosphate phosphatase CheZ